MINQPTFGPLLAEGKTKQIYAYPGDDTLAYMINKDQITAGDGMRRNQREITARGIVALWQRRDEPSIPQVLGEHRDTSKRHALSRDGGLNDLVIKPEAIRSRRL